MISISTPIAVKKKGSASRVTSRGGAFASSAAIDRQIATGQSAVDAGHFRGDIRLPHFHGTHARIKKNSRILRRGGSHKPLVSPDFTLISLAHRDHVFGRYSEESRSESAGSIRVILIHDGSRRGYAHGVLRCKPAEGSQPTYETCGFRTLSTGEGMRLVEDQHVEPGIREQLHVPLASE